MVKKGELKLNAAVWAICLGLVLLVWGVFGQTGRFEFVNYDDKGYVYENSAVRQGVTLQSLREIWTSPQLSNWHPITSLTHLLDVEFFGLDAGRHHRTNVGLHAAAAVLLFLALRRLTGSLWRSALVAALFAVHPLRAEPVAWVSGRKDVLSGIFFSLTLWAYAEYARRPFSVGRYAVVALFFALGLMSKPTLVPLPFLLWLLDYWPLERFQGSERRRVIVEKLPLLALSGAFCVLLAHIQSGVAADATLLSFPWRVANSIRSWAVYVGQTVWPSGLIPIYLHALKSTSLWQVGLAALALLGATGVIAYSARRRPFLAVGWLWFLGMLVPVIGWVQVGIQAHADRYTYLPQTGLFLMLVWMIPARLAERRAGRIALGASAAALLLALSAAAYRQAGFWQNSERLWSRTLAQAPENYVALSNLALVLQEQGRFDEALELLYRARSVAPDRAEIYCNIGDLLARKGRLEEALPHLREAVAIRPQLAQAQYNLGNVLMKLARLDEALVPLQRAVAEDPGMVGAYVDLGSLWIRKGLPEQAIVYLEAALRLQPNFAEVHNNLGIVYLRTGRFELAEACFEQALKVNPGMVEAYKNKGDLRLCLRSYRAAIHCFERALEIRPGFSAAMPGLMMARSALAEQSRARQACYRAIEAEPDSVTVRMRAGGVLASQGLYQEAVEQFEAVLRLDPEHRDACNNLAWILATCPEASVRDGERAVRLARDAMARSPAGTVATLDTLAAALAATGKFSEAAATLRSALESPEVQSAAAARLRARLALYEAARPYVDSVQE